jgi:LPXTG-site transpeptidase (sortase) family protein
LGRDFGMADLRRLRQRFLLGLGVALFAVGAVILSIGLVGYFDQRGGDSATNVVTEPPAVQNLEHMPAVPYDTAPTVTEPAPTPEPTPTPEPVAAPLRLLVESLEVDAPVIEMGLDDQGVPHVPLNGQDVAWYSFSSPPGAGSNAVFAGHINWEGALGVFGDLDELQAGDTVRLMSEDGSEYVYEVFANFPVDPDDPASLKVMAPTSTDTITLITCGGTWIPDPSELFGGSYTNRTIVQARLMESTLAMPAAASEG